MSEIPVQMVKDGPDVPVGLERVSFLTQRSGDITKLKRVCIKALEAGGLIMTSAG